MQAKRLWHDSKNTEALKDGDDGVKQVFHLELSMTAGDCHCLAPYCPVCGAQLHRF